MMAAARRAMLLNPNTIYSVLEALTTLLTSPYSVRSLHVLGSKASIESAARRADLVVFGPEIKTDA
jgi:hypothetical protein